MHSLSQSGSAWTSTGHAPIGPSPVSMRLSRPHPGTEAGVDTPALRQAILGLTASVQLCWSLNIGPGLCTVSIAWS